MRGRVVVLCVCYVGASVPAHAQCPDGSPPPCGRAARPAAPSLALNDNTWLVLPFENTARAADAELIRQASVPQLTGELSRWEGVRVISDDRVADLMQQLPDAQRDRPGLEAARGLARRVGAGKLVLGGYLAAGGRANLTAKVYETRSGRELRTIRDPLSGFQTAAALDSLGASFGRLARGILNVPATSAANSPGVGTSSLEAYRAYVAGMDAFNRLQLDSARQQLQLAVRADPAFAMAHLRLWRVLTDTMAGKHHLQEAMRLSTALPPRARVLVEGFAAGQRNDRAQVCTSATFLVGADSSDAEGWALLSGCFNDRTVVVEDGRPRTRGDLNRALRAADRAIALAPNGITSISALAGILNAAVSFMQCVGPPGPAGCPPDRYYRVSMLPAGDSLNVSIALWRNVKHAPPDLAPAAIEAQIARLRRLRGVFERYALSSDLWVMHNTVARISLIAGDIAVAEEHDGRGRHIGGGESEAAITIYYNGRFEAALARERVAEFQAWAESLFARPPLLPVAPYRSLMGRLGENADTNLTGRLYAAWRPLLAGILPSGLDTLEPQILAQLQGPQREDFLQLTTLAGFHLRRTGPALDTAARHPLKRFQAHFAAGTLPRARAALEEFDRELTARHIVTPDDGGWLFSAESHLELGDSATAFARMREFGNRWATSVNGAYILEMRFFQSTTPRLWGRSWLLYGDLAMARRQTADARRAYRMVVGLWERGDPVLQPFVTRARTALAQLGG